VIQVTGSTFGIIMIVIAAVGGLFVMEVLVLWAAERPYFKHPHPDPMQSDVRGGIHLGDPRSMGAPQEADVHEAVEAHRSTDDGSQQGPRDGERPRPDQRVTLKGAGVR
jgi:hypothetical protein